MAIGGFVTVLWDCWARQKVTKLRADLRRKRRNSNPERQAEESNGGATSVEMEQQGPASDGVQRRTAGIPSVKDAPLAQTAPDATGELDPPSDRKAQGEDITPATDTVSHAIPIKVGIAIIVCFFSEESYPKRFPFHP